MQGQEAVLQRPSVQQSCKSFFVMREPTQEEKQPNEK